MRFLHEKGSRPSVINRSVGLLSSLWTFANGLRLCPWPAPSPILKFDPTVTGFIVRPEKLQRGRKLGGKRPGSISRPNPTRLDGTLWSYFQIMYVRQRLFGKSPETIRLYGHSFDYFREFLGREPKLKDLKDETIMRLMEWIVAVQLPDGTPGRGLAARTANKTRDQIVAMWSFLARKGVVRTWPEVASFPEPKRTPVAWSQPELKALWEMLAHQGGNVCGIPAAKYWLALHSVAYDTLERIGALKQVCWSDLSDDCVWLHIRGETRKGRRNDFTAKLHHTTAALLNEIREPKRILIFPWDKNPSYFWSKYRHMREVAGIASDRKHSFHCLRKTGASFAEAAGADASKLLGHSSRRVTVDHYLDPRMIPQIHGADILPRPDAALTTAGGES